LKNLLVFAKKFLLQAFLVLLILFLAWGVSIKNYFLFHSVIEIITIAAGFSAMLVSIKTHNISNNDFFRFLGITSGFAMVITLIHVITYKGAAIFTTDPNIPTQLYIFYKYYECISLVFAFYFISHKLNIKKIIISNLILIVIFIWTILFSNSFPDCYNESTGLTFFKIFSEFLFCIFYIVILTLIKFQTLEASKYKLNLISISIIFKLMSSLCFSFYTDVYGRFNFSGHIFNFISYCLFYTALFKGVIIDPYESLVEKLTAKTNELEIANKHLIAAKLKIEKDYKYNEKLINFLPDGILILEHEKIIYSNKRFMDMFHLSSLKDILGKDIFSIIDKPYHPLLFSRLNALDKNILLSPVDYEIQINNKKIFAEVCSLFTAYQGSEQLIMAIRDISDKKRAEDMSLKLLEIEKAEELKNEFFINLSHELKTPINVMYSALQLQSIYSNDPVSISKYNDLMKKNCLRLIRLSDNMLDITKIQSGFLKPKLIVENIVPVIENISLSIIDYLQFKSLNLVFDTEYEELYASFDRGLLERILLNLLSNSIKYGKENGHIYVNIYTEEDTIAISIKDDGIGMQLEDQKKIFMRLQKLDNSLSRNTEGSGVGLFLVKSFTEIQHGTISFTSKPDEGTEFIIRFSRIYECEEVCATIDNSDVSIFKDTMEKVDIEFSDIYT